MTSVCFVSNYLSLHQISVCKEFSCMSDVEFTFVSSFGPSGFKKQLSNYEYESFVIRAYESETEFLRAKHICETADLVIFGSGDLRLIKGRTNIIFRYSEHFSRSFLSFFLKAISVHFKYYKESKNGYLLCSSSHSRADFNFAGLYKKRCLYYGYFPEVIPYEKAQHKKLACQEKMSILWVGRGLKLKHPEIALRLAKDLFKMNFRFEMTICCTETSYFKKIIKKNQNEKFMNNVVVLTEKKHDEILNLMLKSDMFLFTSDRKEGWGAVLNEAMSSKCCCFANSSAGSTKFLIKHKFNGFVYKNYKELLKYILLCFNKRELAAEMGENALLTINNVWNAKNAVSNIMSIFNFIVSNNKIPDSLINNGPGTLMR